MTRISSALAALSVLACQVVARPQSLKSTPSAPVCQIQESDYKILSVSEPYKGRSFDFNPGSCISEPSSGCQITKQDSVSYGVSEPVSVGLDVSKILGLSASYSYVWSVDTAVAESIDVSCPGFAHDYECGMLGEPMMVKITGQVRHHDSCKKDEVGYVPFEFSRPWLGTTGVTATAKERVNVRPCIKGCPGTKGSSLDCDGAREAIAAGMPACQETALKQQPAGTGTGWCTAHIVQHQRWQGSVGDEFQFDLKVIDDHKTEIYSQQNKKVDAAGRISWPVTKLPKELITRAGTGDNDPVAICYGDQCFHCDDHDGGEHQCTLGNGKEYGWDNNKREGDFGFHC